MSMSYILFAAVRIQERRGFHPHTVYIRGRRVPPFDLYLLFGGKGGFGY